MALEIRFTSWYQATTLLFVALQLREVHVPNMLRFYE